MKSPFPKEIGQRALANLLVVMGGILFAVFCFQFQAIWAFLRNVLGILTPFAVGFFIAYLILPLDRFIEKIFHRLAKSEPHGRRRAVCRTFSLIISYLIVFSVAIAILCFMLPQLFSSIFALLEIAPDYVRRMVNGLLALMAEYEISNEYLVKLFGSWEDIITQAINTLKTWIPGIIALSADITSSVLNFFIGIIISIYMLFGRERFAAQGRKLLNALFQKQQTDTLIHWLGRSSKAFGDYVVGKIIDSAVVGVICYIGMLCFGMSYSLLISVIVGLTNVIPFFGPFVGGAIGTIILLMIDPLSALIFVLFILVLQQVDGNIIGPRILGESIGLSALWIMLAILLGSGLFGFVGLITSIPLFAVLYAIAQTLIENRLRKRNLPTDIAAYYASPEDAPQKKPRGIGTRRKGGNV